MEKMASDPFIKKGSDAINLFAFSFAQLTENT